MSPCNEEQQGSNFGTFKKKHNDLAKKSYTTKLCIIDIFLMGFHFRLSDLSFERTGKNCSLPSLKVVDSD
jgi:hypothetical protein